MKRYFLVLFIPVIFLSCNTESIRKEVYGNMTVVTTTIERERILASG